jgi:hypothetical protein
MNGQSRDTDNKNGQSRDTDSKNEQSRDTDNKNGQSRDTDNIGYTRHRTKVIENQRGNQEWTIQRH